MIWEEELQRLKRDLANLNQQAGALSGRIAYLERCAREEAKNKPLNVGPPPLPTAEEAVFSPPEWGTYTPPPPVNKVAPPSPTPIPAAKVSADASSTTPAGAPPGYRPIVAQESVVERFFRERMEAIRAKTKEVGWEMSLGTYWLPRVAVLLIAIAVVFFSSLAIQRWGAQWLPHIRVLTGYGVCAAMLVMAWRSELKYAGLSRVLYGGGFAVMYFITFATYYIRFARIFDSPVPTLLLLAVVVLVWTAAAQVRQSKIIATMVTAFGHLTVLLSTLTLTEAGPYSTAGLLLLAAGSAFFLLRNRWYYVSALGMVGAYANDFAILIKGHGTDPYMDFSAAMGVLAGLALLFALAELFSPAELRRGGVPTWFRSALVSVNSLCFLGLGTLLMGAFQFTQPHQDLFRLMSSAVLLLIGLAYLRLRAGDPLYNVYMTKAVALFTVGLATRYGGSTLAVSLAAETLVLLWAAQRSGLLVSRVLALATAVLAFAYVMVTASDTVVGYDSAQYARCLIQGCLSIAAFLGASQLYQRTDWCPRSPATLPLPKEWLIQLWQLDLINEAPDKGVKKVFGGLLLPYAYALAGVIMLLPTVHMLAENGHRFAMLAVSALALLAVAEFLGSKPFGLASLVLLLIGVLPTGTYELPVVAGAPLPAAIAGLVAVCLIALSSEHERIGRRPVLEFHQHEAAPYVLYGVAAWLIGLLMQREFDAGYVSMVFTVAAAAAAGLSLVLRPMAFTGIMTAYVLWACGLFAQTVLPPSETHSWTLHLAAWTMVMGALLADRFVNERKLWPPLTLVAGILLVGDAWLVLMLYLRATTPASWLAAAMAVSSFAFMAYFGLFRSPMAFVAGVFGAALASVSLCLRVLGNVNFAQGTVVGFVLLAGFWVLCERLLWRYHGLIRETLKARNVVLAESPDKDHFLGIPIVIATGMLLLFLHRLPQELQANPTFITMGWFGLAVGLYLISIAVHQALYRYVGIAVIAFSLVRVFFVDMKEQDPLLRVAAFAVLGIGLLALSYGYFRWMAALRKKDPPA